MDGALDLPAACAALRALAEDALETLYAPQEVAQRPDPGARGLMAGIWGYATRTPASPASAVAGGGAPEFAPDSPAAEMSSETGRPSRAASAVWDPEEPSTPGAGGSSGGGSGSLHRANSGAGSGVMPTRLAARLQAASGSEGGASGNTGAGTTGEARMHLAHGSARELRGEVTLRGLEVVEAALQVQFASANRGRPLEATVSPERPLPVRQLRTAEQLLRRAVHAVRAFEDAMGAGEASLGDADDFLAALGTLLRKVTHTLEDPVPFCFPYPQPATGFRSLPPEVLVDVGVCSAQLVVRAFSLQPLAHPPATPPSVRVAHRVHSLVKQKFVYRQGWAEVLEQARVTYPLPHIEEALNCVAQAVESAASFRHSVQAMLSVSSSCGGVSGVSSGVPVSSGVEQTT